MKIVFSYDCEGNWAFVDRSDTVLADGLAGPLQDAYRFLRDAHLESGIPATFAFVGLYALPAAARADYLARSRAQLGDRMVHLGRSGGCWDGAVNFDTIRDAARASDLIEIGSHSLTHVPFGALSVAAQRHELAESRAVLTDLSGERPQAFVFPRNQIGSLPDCAELYRTYRNSPALTGMARFADHARFVTGLAPSQARQQTDLLYWRGGTRKYLPDNGWKRLWERRMAAARAGSGHVETMHVYGHPHNLVTDPATRDRLQWLFRLLRDNRSHLQFLKLSEVDPDGNKIPAEA